MQKVNLNLIPGGVRPVVNVSQYDEGRQFQLAIFQGSASYDLTGKTVTIEVGKTDGNGCAYGVTDLVNGVPVVAVSGNLVTITTPRQMTACSGENMAELKIAASGNELGTLNFVLLCEQSALSPDTPISETEIPAIVAAAEEAASHYPYIDSISKNWFVWSVEQGAFVDTGVRAEGIDGQGSVQTVNNVSPDVGGNVSLALSNITTVPITTANGGTGNAYGYIRTGKTALSTVGDYATAEGNGTIASGDMSHAEGQGFAYGIAAHAEGYRTSAQGHYSHAEGDGSTATGNRSHAAGDHTIAGYNNQYTCGVYNNNKSDDVFEIGNGTSGARHNIMEVHTDGRVVMGEADALVSGGNLDAVVELTRTMTAQRDAGTYVFVVADKKTYHIDTTISINGTLYPGTNATEATVFEKLRELTSELTSKITGSWVNIPVQTPSADITTYQSDQYRTSAYIVRGGLCYVNLAIKVNADIGDTSKVVLPSGVLPAPSIPYSIQATFKPPAWSSFGTPSNQIFAESLYQGNVLYIRKAVAGDYSISFVYPVASP